MLRPVSAVTSNSSILVSRLSIDETVYDPDAPTTNELEKWLAEGDVNRLERVVLDGRAHLLIDKDSVNISSIEFLGSLNQYQVRNSTLFLW